MKRILARANAAVLERLAAERALVALDFDGTLAPISGDPTAAVMPAETRAALERVAERYPCAIVSGRGLADLRARLDGVRRLARLVANHGAEWDAGGPPAEDPRPLVTAWRRALEPRLGPLPGVCLEDKGLSLAIHYRNAADPARAAAEVWRAVKDLPRARLIGGKAICNVVPQGALDKGTALARLREALGASRCLYVGDDDTDEDVFRLGAPWLVGVRVGREAASKAAYVVADLVEVRALLERLAALRP